MIDESKEKTKVTFKKLDESRPIQEWQEIRLTKMNHIVEILRIANEPKNFCNLRKLNKTEYVRLDTGEILEYKLNENRAQNISGLKRTFKVVRNMINNNFTGAANELFVTLTYGDNIADTVRLQKDFDRYMKRLKRKYPDVEYMSVIEPQARGAWHCHVLMKFTKLEKVYIDNDKEMAPMWGHGWTTTRSLKNVDNIGAYLNAYLSDVEVCDENASVLLRAIEKNQFDIIELEDGSMYDLNKGNRVDLRVVERDIVEGDGKRVRKKFVKGARLHMYPSGMNLYRCSRGIKKPETEKMLYREAKKIVGPGPANYSRTIDLDRDGQPINSITYEQYNLKRGKIQ